MQSAMAAKLADRHLPLEPVLRDIMRHAIEFEYVISARYAVALLPDNRWEFLEFRGFPDGVNSLKSYARETAKPLMINGDVRGHSLLAGLTQWRTRNRVGQ